MSKLPLITAKDLIKILLRLGFELKRQKGSHKFFQHQDGRTTVVPDHGNEQIDRGLLNKIIKQDLMLSIEEFLRIK
ncbi:MAG: type II toxin-antitoxin system HicA family toxin [Bacteroidota bacterium]|jgi:predicted RNA binding protein YcfA (HicA-like mRNA interferase family)|nr:type II toxin-antitoxin system HicA family toxin [Bacteroidota bacterium]